MRTLLILLFLTASAAAQESFSGLVLEYQIQQADARRRSQEASDTQRLYWQQQARMWQGMADTLGRASQRPVQPLSASPGANVARNTYYAPASSTAYLRALERLSLDNAKRLSEAQVEIAKLKKELSQAQRDNFRPQWKSFVDAVNHASSSMRGYRLENLINPNLTRGRVEVKFFLE